MVLLNRSLADIELARLTIVRSSQFKVDDEGGSPRKRFPHLLKRSLQLFLYARRLFP